MAINIKHTYSTHVSIVFYSDDGLTLRCDDVGTMDEIAERICEVLVNHNFAAADACSTDTGEILLMIERS